MISNYLLILQTHFGVRKIKNPLYLDMYIKRKKNRSGSTSVVVAEKVKGKYKELTTIGISSDAEEIEKLVTKGKKWIEKAQDYRHPKLDFNDTESKLKAKELESTEKFISQIDNVLINGTQLILNRTFDGVGFNAIEDDVFRHLVLSRLTFPSSKSATVEYLKNYYDEDLNLSKIYRYLDKLDENRQREVQDISVKHTMKLLGGSIGVIFYDVTTLYFETDNKDTLRIPGYSKEGRHTNPQIILGLLVSIGGYPLAYTIHEGNKYEGHTMLPVIERFINEYQLKDFIVVADSGLMSSSNIEELKRLKYKYIIGARIKNRDKATKEWILSQPKEDRKMVEYINKDKSRLLVGYTEARGKKDKYNREKGVLRLEKSYNQGKLTKEHINKRGYNKYLEMNKDVQVSINYEKIEADAAWDGLKGYLTNTALPAEQVYEAYHNLWTVEQAFRISKSNIEIRPIFHFTRKRIEAHICICFVALKVYKELDRLLKLASVGISVDKVLKMAQTVTTIKIKLPLNGEVLSKTLIMQRHKKIEKLFDDDFWGTQ